MKASRLSSPAMVDAFCVGALAALFILSLALSLGLTFAPCYSTLCPEEFFPYDTRLHIAVYYAMLALAAIVLYARAHVSSLRRVSQSFIVRKPLPLVSHRITLGGVTISIYLVTVILVTTAFWVSPQISFYRQRAIQAGGDMLNGTINLAVTAIIGHHADMAVGLLMLPVARTSLLGRVFRVHQSTLLTAHKLLGYLAFVAVVAHGCAYFSWMPYFTNAPTDADRDVFEIDNPTLSKAEADQRSPWFLGTLGTGFICLLIFILMVFTSLPAVRRRNYNLFYYAHSIFAALFLLGACLHASTDFYFLIPGLVLWFADLIRRMRWLTRTPVDGVLEDAGAGWYRVRLPSATSSPPNNGSAEAARLTQPLQSFNLNFPAVSKLQVHAFTAASVDGITEGQTTSFLFRPVEGRKRSRLDREWTWKLARLLPQHPEKPSTLTLPLHIEGPYISHAENLFSADRVLCLVAGTGVTGALSLAHAWRNYQFKQIGVCFRLVWTVRYADLAGLDEIRTLQAYAAEPGSHLEIIIHVSSEAGRLQPTQALESFFSGLATSRGSGNKSSPETLTAPTPAHVPSTSTSEDPFPSSTLQGPAPPSLVYQDRDTDPLIFPCHTERGWVYSSGPGGFLDGCERACVDYARQLRHGPARYIAWGKGVGKLDWYTAKWEV